MADRDDEIKISGNLLRELELALIEDRKRIDRHLRLLAILRGSIREKPVLVYRVAK